MLRLDASNPKTMPDLIEEVIPPNRVHLLAGLSDAGKTRWVIPAMLQWEAGLNVLGRASHPCPWAYVAGDRTIEEARETIRDMSLDPDAIRIIPAFGKHNKNWVNILLAASALRPQPRLLVVEGFGDLCEGERKFEVREFLSRVIAICQGGTDFPDGLTILGVMESPKLKPAERYSNPRQRVSGVSAWGYHTSTVLLVEAVPGDDAMETSDRTFWVCTKRGKRRKLEAHFDDRGILTVSNY